jgi:hypothetical protein
MGNDEESEVNGGFQASINIMAAVMSADPPWMWVLPASIMAAEKGGEGIRHS